MAARRDLDALPGQMPGITRPLTLPAQHADQALAVGEIPIAAAVAAILRGAGAGDLVGGPRPPRRCQVADDEIALGIEIGADMVGDLAGIVTEANAAVEAGGGEP